MTTSTPKMLVFECTDCEGHFYVPAFGAQYFAEEDCVRVLCPSCGRLTWFKLVEVRIATGQFAF